MNSSSANSILSPATILNASKLTPAQARYWNALARREALRVEYVDPFRTPLRELRATHPELRGHKIYRASTGGRYGKSKQIVVL